MFEVIRNTASFKATSSLTASQFRMVTLDSNGQIVLPSVGGDAIGILQDKPAAGDPGSVALAGSISKVFATGTLVAGGNFSTDATGGAIPSVTGDFILGRVVVAASANQVGVVLFQPRASKM